MSASFSLLVDLQAEQVLILLTGLPGSGKTLIAKRLLRCLCWMGIPTQLFASSTYTKSCSVGDNDGILSSSQQALQSALSEALSFLAARKGKVAIVDAPFNTEEDRTLAAEKAKEASAQPTFIETVTVDPAVSRRMMVMNVQDAPWYKEMPQEDALRDLSNRATAAKLAYKSVNSPAYCWARLYDMGRSLEVNNATSHLQSRIMFYLMSFHAHLRPIYFTRHGQSTASAVERIGTDEDLSREGELFAHALATWVADAQPQPTEVWTSTLKRAIGTCKFIPLPKKILKELDEVRAGVCDGMTYKEIEEKMPEVAAQRAKDKLKFRYPGGESYQDVIERLEPIMFELERRQEPVLVVGHQATLRCVYAFFTGKAREEVPFISFPVNTVIEMIPQSYTYREIRHKLM